MHALAGAFAVRGSCFRWDLHRRQTANRRPINKSKTLMTLAQALDSAVERGLLNSNPARGWRSASEQQKSRKAKLWGSVQLVGSLAQAVRSSGGELRHVGTDKPLRAAPDCPLRPENLHRTDKRPVHEQVCPPKHAARRHWAQGPPDCRCGRARPSTERLRLFGFVQSVDPAGLEPATSCVQSSP